MRPALFLDRDGVVNVEKNYLHKIEEFEFIDGIFDVCRHYQARGFLIVIVTNQSGIARGYYSEEDFEALTEWMVAEFEKRGISIAKVYHCPHHPDISGACSCRKPEPGMFLQAAKELNLDLEHSVMVGDSERDIVAAHRAGVRETYLLDGEAAHSDATRIITSLRELL
jgi:D-glycero-D-manno-heptose 1,7-bisphosphate phosphatase